MVSMHDRRTSTESRLSRVTKLLVRGSTSFATTCSSQVTGTPAALKIFLTALAISGPTPAFRRGGKGGRDVGPVLRSES